MQLNLERPDYQWYLRGAEGDHALVNERVIRASFVISPDALLEDWPVTDARALEPAQLAPILAMRPELVLLGTGATQVFPPAAILATFLTRGLGVEVMMPTPSGDPLDSDGRPFPAV